MRIKFHPVIPSVIAGMLFILASCGFCRTTTIPESERIRSDYENDNVQALIEDLWRYPMSRSLTESLLFHQTDYSVHSYSGLKDYALAAEPDFEAAVFFDSLKYDRQEQVLRSLSQMPLAQVGDFYRKNCEEHDYLHWSLMPLFDGVDSLDYRSLKELNDAFLSTDLQQYVNPRYVQMRDSLLTDICCAVDEYFSIEKRLASDVETAVRAECESYIEEGVSAVISSLAEKEGRGLFQRTFKRKDMDRYSFREYADLLIDRNLNPALVEKTVRERLSGWMQEVNRYRNELTATYLGDAHVCLASGGGGSGTSVRLATGDREIDKIKGIKAVGSALSWGSLAIGFIPGINMIGIIADAVDLIYGLRQSGKVNEAMSRLSDALYEGSISGADEYITSVFKAVNTNISDTNNLIKEALYETL